jgi:hypothetical protein
VVTGVPVASLVAGVWRANINGHRVVTTVNGRMRPVSIENLDALLWFRRASGIWPCFGRERDPMSPNKGQRRALRRRLKYHTGLTWV